jgi:hypothetical protein
MGNGNDHLKANAVFSQWRRISSRLVVDRFKTTQQHPLDQIPEDVCQEIWIPPLWETKTNDNFLVSLVQARSADLVVNYFLG